MQVLTALGLGGSDTFQVTPAAGTQFAPNNLDNLLVNVNGGNDTDNALVVQAAGGGALAANQFVVVAPGLDADTGRVRVYTAAVQWPDISYTNVQVVSPNVASVGGQPNLLILGPDGNEPNEFQANAAFLGSGANIQIQHAAIFPTSSEFPGVAADNDFYRLVADQTGTLDFQVYFKLFSAALLPGGGALNLQVLDAAGNIVGASTGAFGAAGATGNARVRIPAVAGQSYFLHVFGATAAAVNGYDATIINTPAPTPFDVQLSRRLEPGTPDSGNLPATAPMDDTGSSLLDNITFINTPTVFLRVNDALLLNDLPGNATTDSPPAGPISIPFSATGATAGYRVAIFDGNDTRTPVGFASPVAGFPGLYQFDFTAALNEGQHHISAEVQLVDPANPSQSGFGAISQSLDLVVNTVAPVPTAAPVSPPTATTARSPPTASPAFTLRRSWAPPRSTPSSGSSQPAPTARPTRLARAWSGPTLPTAPSTTAWASGKSPSSR